MILISILFKLVGSLSFLLFGMKLMSDGIQKSTGKSLHKALSFMTKNRFMGLLTGLFVTMIIQSSGGTTVMVVSFVNAGLITLAQSVGVIFGANIGTTVTAWIVALFGFNFNIAAVAIPLFGLGYLLRSVKKLKKETLGEAIMGFSLLFFGLDLLKNLLDVNPEQISVFQSIFNHGLWSYILAILLSIFFTALLHSSSAVSAIVITLSYQQLLSWEIAAAMILGSNIGSTIDAVMASFGTKVNARRAALVHVMFNVFGFVLAMFFFKPFLRLTDWIVPGPVQNSITIHIAMLHTLFNIFSSLIFLPFTRQMAQLSELIIKPKKGEVPDIYTLTFIKPSMKDNYEAYIIQAEKEIADMTDIAIDMFTTIQKGFINRTKDFVDEHFDKLSKQEDYADQMQEEISNFLIQYSHLPIADRTKHNVSIMLRIIDDLESITDECFSILLLLKRSIEKEMTFNDEDMERLEPYGELVQQFLLFIKKNINKHLSRDQLRLAEVLEDQVDAFRKNLKKVARKRLEKGADVRSELLYIDLVRYIEKIGDYAFSISEALAETK
ncbi:MAG TPA: Na/Pi cotransporter family protein [Treponemataceae bacterium]|nr:Na/Pi cotransporter family protein [Treponemataceae bacterium]